MSTQLFTQIMDTHTNLKANTGKRAHPRTSPTTTATTAEDDVSVCRSDGSNIGDNTVA